MNRILELAGNITGWLGILLCLLSGGARITGMFYLAGFQAITLFMGGMALMLASCVLKLETLNQKARSRF